MIKQILKFFDRLEDRVRGKLSRKPIFYAFVGGVGIVIFWRGIWHTADFVMDYFFGPKLAESTLNLGSLPWWDGPLSIAAGLILLLSSGVFVSNFIGNEIILSGLRGEKKLAEKTENEVKTEVGAIGEIKRDVKAILKKIDKLERQ